MVLPRRAMAMNRRHALQLILTATGLVLVGRHAAALDREPGGYYLTGSGVRVKSIGPFTAKVYAISHFMRDLPPRRSKQAVIAMDTDKAFSWRLLRNLEAKQIRDALGEAFAKNGYADRAKINTFLGAFTKPLSEGGNVTITYATTTKATTLAVQGDGTATVPGFDFMQATWSIWFGNIDQPALGDALIRRIPDAPPSG